MAANNRASSHQMSIRIAFCGLIAALSSALMLAGSTIPIATYCIPMAAGVLLLPVFIEFGKKAAWTTFFSVALITLLLGVDKEAAFFYLFLGHYPLIKWDIDRIKNRPLRLLTKLLVSSFLVVLMYLVLGYILNMHALLEEFSEIGMWFTAALLILFDFCMLLYDRLLLPLLFLYANRIRPRLRFLLR